MSEMVRVSVALRGVEPGQAPVPEQGGTYTLEIREGTPIRSILSLFGLEESGLTFLLNGKTATADQIPGPGDELTLVLMALGG